MTEYLALCIGNKKAALERQTLHQMKATSNVH